VRRGAVVTGIDLSDEAIKKANELKERMNLEAEFICCNVYDTLAHIDTQFDIVFTSYGTIGWLPDLNKWADVICKSLKPGGIFLLVEFHPVVWMFDNAIKEIKYSYFNKETIAEIEEGTYADREAEIENNKSVSWNHSLDESISALLHAGLHIEAFKEYDYSPYNIYTDGIEIEKNKFQIKGLEGKLPLVFALKAKKDISDAAI
ncbi:MAG: methyltransferase domain-containing protein, partial [Fimbriimonadaceae bacterium]|nr:methyltransferase domain-containing protein [Chitinophagales bacterium]